MAKAAKLVIDIVSDVVCPWCIIGYKQMEAALESMGDAVDADLRWHPFELSPDTPSEGQALAEYARDRYGATPDQSRKNRTRIVEAGTPLGIDFRYSDDSRIYNTFKAHQLLHWAEESGQQTALKLALFQAYFTAQHNVSDDNVLLQAVEAAGLDRAAAETVLADQRYAGTVRAEERFWQDQNITGVPAYIVNGKYMIPGAQDAQTFRQVFERVIERERLQSTEN